MAVKARILVVEDDGAIRALLADRLRQYDLVFATCQAECYEQLETPNFDLVLLDLRLPRTPEEMTASNQVGLDILVRIRTTNITRREAAMLMPVIVMTAHGSEKLTASVLVDHRASDYIPKPFGTGDDLEHKIARALDGTAALMPAAKSVSSTSVQLSFHPNGDHVRVDKHLYRGVICKLLVALRDQYLRDQAALLLYDEYRRLRGGELANMLGISEPAVRRQIERFRRKVEADLQSLGRALDTNAIIENARDWEGYRLNPFVVHIVRWQADRN